MKTITVETNMSNEIAALVTHDTISVIAGPVMTMGLLAIVGAVITTILVKVIF